jgi:hypothetical protein
MRNLRRFIKPRLGAWLACAACLAVPAARAAAQDTTHASTAHITYVTSSSAYIDAGRLDGLKEGAAVEVLRGGAAVASLKVAYLASHQASCDIVTTSVTLIVGDSVRFMASADRRTQLAADSAGGAAWPAEATRGRTGPHTHTMRGRLGVRYLEVRPRDGIGSTLSQPSFDLRLDGAGLAGAPFGIAVDVRTRLTSSTRPDGTSVADGRTRVYQAALFMNRPGAPFRFTVGRQFSPALASLNLFDGAMAEYNKPSWGFGLFGGTEPDPLDLGYSGEIQDYGGYVQVHNRPTASAQWFLTVGGIGSYEQGQANREFGYVQAAVTMRRFSLFATQEIDYYRPWKRTLGEAPVSLTSTFSYARYELVDGVSLNAGFDNRRNVRLYRDAVNPETAFDDQYRQGVWGGLSLYFARHVRVGFDARSSTGGSAGDANAYTGSLGLERLTSFGLSLRSRSTRYTNPTLSGWLHSVTMGVDPFSRLHLELNGGLRSEENPLANPSSLRVTWFGADVDVSLARSVYLILSGTRETGGQEGNDQIYAALTYRF